MAVPTRAKRLLGQTLDKLREDAGLTNAAMALALKVSDTTITRYLTGEMQGPWTNYLEFVRLCGGDEGDLAEVSRLYDQTKDEAPPLRLPSSTPKAFRRLINEERTARKIRTVQSIVFPGLLQTREYAQALFDAGNRFNDPRSRVDGALSVRLQRQERLLEGSADPVQYHAILDEAVIRRSTGGPAVMASQLEHVADLIRAERIKAQVVPFVAGAYGLTTGGCVIVDYEVSETSGVYLEYPLGGAWVEDPEDVRRFTTMFEDAERVALSTDKTMELITQQIRAVASP